MGQSLCLEFSQQLALTGGLSESVFPKIDLLLQEGEYQEALQFIASRKSMERYQSMVDFILCEIFVQFRKDCFKYYEGTGEPFRKMIESGVVSEADREWCERVLGHGLELARRALVAQRDRREYSWTVFRKETLSLGR